MKLTYGVSDKPSFGKVLVFALQQLLAILAATIAVPAIINSSVGTEMSSSAALFGAGVGTIVYLLFTKFKSPVFLGSSFAPARSKRKISEQWYLRLGYNFLELYSVICLLRIFGTVNLQFSSWEIASLWVASFYLAFLPDLLY